MSPVSEPPLDWYVLHNQRPEEFPNWGRPDRAGGVVGMEFRYLDAVGDSKMQLNAITDPTTGRRLTLKDAVAVWDRFSEELLGDDNNIHESLLPTWRRLGTHAYECSIKFPPELGSITISSCNANAMDAKRSACLLSCQALATRGLLDCTLFPPLTHDISGQATPHEVKSSAVSSGSRCYSKKTPLFWQRSLQCSTSLLYPTIISVDFPRSDHYSPMLLLTKLPLPSFSSFYVFCSGQKGTVTLQKARPLDVDEQQRHILLGYTMRISRSVQNKAMSFTSEELPYFFAPLSHAPRQRPDDWWNFPDISNSVPWDAAKLAADNYVVPLSLENSSIDDQTVDAIIQERWVEFTNRQYVKVVRYDLTPLSRPEKGTREAGSPSFFAYCEAHRKEFTGLKVDQPLLEVSLVPNVINNSDPFGKVVESSKPPAKYLIPEFCAKFTIPASNFRTALLLPSILHRIDGILLTKELNSNLFDDALNEDLLYTAISCPSANLETDYNRLEFLGDAFLKYVVSAHCFVTMPEKREGGLHSVRQQIVSNRALHNGVVNTGLPAYIQGKPLIVKIWQPVTKSTNQKESSGAMNTRNDTNSGEEKRGKRKRQQDDQSIQWLGDKTVADVVEALIGAAYLSNGIDLALKVTQTLKIAISDVEEWSRFANTSPVSRGRIVDLSPSIVTEVERIVGRPLKPTVLAQALTHTSLQASQLLPYDRLEFLGDAVLDFLVVRYLYDRYPHLPPGGLTLLKVAMVTNSALATICVVLRLHRFVQHSSPGLFLNMNTFAEEIVRLQDEEERISQIENRLPRQFWSEVDAPKVLSDIIESIIGALLVSNDFSLTAVEGFFDTTLKPFFERYIRLQTLSCHPNITLYEFFQAAGCQQHRIQKDVDHDTIHCSVLVHDVVLATITGTSSSGTVRMVSTAALTALDDDPNFMKRVCDCRLGANQNQPRNKDKQAQLGYEAD